MNSELETDLQNQNLTNQDQPNEETPLKEPEPQLSKELLELTKSEQQFNVAKDQDNKKSEAFVQINNEVYLFKYLYSKEQRLTWSEEARTKYPNKFPIIVEKDHKC